MLQLTDILVANKRERKSYQILMGLIGFMFLCETVSIACNWYITWLGFIHYDGATDQALDALMVDGSASLALRVIGSTLDLVVTLRLAIADSIMVSLSVLE
jgi:hypothetical protein